MRVLFRPSNNINTLWQGWISEDLSLDSRINMVSENNIWEDGVYQIIAFAKNILFVEAESDFISKELKTIKLELTSANRI